MSEVAERPDLQERVGSAVNASRLVMRTETVGAADVLAAMGGASQELRDGRLNESGKRVGKDSTAAELAPMLWRLKGGGQEELKVRAARLLSQRVAQSDERFRRTEQSRREWLWPSAARFAAELLRRTEDAQRRELMAHQVITEWIREVCPTCHGYGKRDVASGRRRGRLGGVARQARPAGAMLGKKLMHCDACNGTGRARVSDATRAHAMGMGLEEFRDRWSRRFERMERELHKVAGRLTRPLAKRLSGRVTTGLQSSR